MMDWEQKFASIVHETEANLQKVREKINSKTNGINGDSSLYKYESPHHKRYSMDYTPSPRSLRFSQYDRTRISNPDRVHTDYDYLGSAQSNIVHLQERLEAQNKTIEQLTSLVKSLESERNQYRYQIDELRSELSQLNSSFTDHKSSSYLKLQIDQMKKEVSKEIDNLRSQLICLKAKSINQPYSDTPSSLISKDIQNIRSDVQEDMYYLRRDLDVLKSRIGSLEHNVTAFSTQQEIRRRDFLIKDLENYKQRRLAETLSTLPLAERNLETTQLEQLRLSVDSLKNKIDQVEGKMNQLPPTSSIPTKDYSVSSDDEITSDLSSSLDLEEFAEEKKPLDESFDVESHVDEHRESPCLDENGDSLGFEEHDADVSSLDNLSLGSDVDDFFLN